MPHVGALKDENGAKCPFAKQQSPTEEKQKRVTPRVDTDYMPGMVTLAASNKDEVKFLQELGFQLVDISQPVAISSPDGSEKQVKLDELGGISLTLVIPGISEPLHVVVTGTELVHELRQFTVERKESSYRTCLGLYHNGAKLEEFVEVASIEGIKNGSVIKFEEEPYSLRDARIHICRTKEILADNIDMLCSGSEGMSFSFLSHITITNPEEDVKAGASDATTTPTKEAVQPPNHCLPTAVNQHPPLSAFYPRGYHNKPPDCLKELHYSKWNPPPSQRQLRGDLLYLTVHTLEGEEYGITSCHSGFFVNKCSGDQVFDPNPAKLSHHSHHLIGLLNQVSPLFKKNFALLHKQGSKCHTLEVFPSPFKVYPWVVPHREHTLDNYFTLEGVFGAKVAIEEQFIGQSQDWNEQFQSIKEMPTATIAEKLAKEKAYYKAYMEYTNIAVKGAVAAVDGNIPPINCSEHVKQRMFIWNNIFLTFAFDSRDNYSDVGGDKAAWKAASHDLKNLSLLNSFDIEGIYCSATVIVDYRGYRVIAQTIIPGILSQNHEHTVSYGTIDNGKNISSNERLTEKLKPVAKEFFFKGETLLDQAGQEVSLVTSMDIKGIIGQDDRCYVVDLFRMLPPDANWFNWPDDCCFGKSENAHPTVKTPNDKDDVSDGNTVSGVVHSAGNTTTSEKVTKISSKTVDLNEVSTTCDASVPSDTVTITLVRDKTIVQTTSGTAVIGTTSEDSTNVEPLNDATTLVAADKPSHETEDDVISDKFQEAASNIELSSSNGAVHSDENLNCRVESYVANSITSDTPCDREADTSSYMLNGDGTNAHCNNERRDSHTAKLSDNENLVTGVSSHKPLDTATGMINNEETSSELEVSRKDMVSSDSITEKQKNDTECDTSADKTTDVEGDVFTTGDVNLDTKGTIPSDKETKESVKTDSPVNKRTDSEGDTIGDERTDREGDECTLSDKRTCTKSDQINDKRAVTEGDTLTDKITDTVSEVLNRTHLGHDVTHKEIEASTKDDSISDYRLIIETYKKRMKQNQSRHKLKFLRPELVKAYIHFKRLVYIQLLSASMEMNKKKSKEETKAEDHVTEKTLSDCDTVKEHPSTTANGSGEIEPHPSSDIEDTATPEPCPSTLTNGINHSDEECAVPYEGRTGSKLEVVNGKSPSLENHEEFTTATTAAVTMDQSQSDQTCPVSTSEAAAADIIMNKEDYFDIKFNIDLFTPGARHSKPEAELQKDFKILEDIGQFLLESVIPKLVNDCLQLLVVPSDGEALSNLMHLRGINMRYLGIIADLSTYRKDLDHLFQLCITEMVGRAAKRLLTSELQQGSLHNVATIIVCFLNCYLGLPAESSSEAAQEEPKKKSKKKRKGLSKTESLSLLLNKASVWSSIVEMICNNFCYEMKYASIEELCTTLHISKIVLLRRLCKTSGIQLIVREYNFTAQPTFSEGDIINILPVVKTAVIKPTDGGALFELASSQVNAGNLGNAQELATQSLGVYSQVFGPLHSDVANCYRLMSRMHFMAGESVPAMCFQHKAVMIFERVLGMDHPDTVAAYVNLALYCHHCEQTTVALRLMYRVRYLILLMFGQDTPELATCDSNIALMLHSCKEYELSLIFLEHALRLNLKYHGEGSIQVALNHHLIARGLTFTGDYRSALHHEKITYNIHKEKFGENHQRTKESAECLEQLTEKAVKMQKQINEITSHFPSSSRATAGGVDVPGQWSDVAMMSNSSKKPTKSTRTKKKSRSKIDGEHVKGTTQ